jgi:hypothetical protein
MSEGTIKSAGRSRFLALAASLLSAAADAFEVYLLRVPLPPAIQAGCRPD